MGPPCLPSGSEKTRVKGVQKMMGRRRKKIKGLRNYTTLYICTVPRVTFNNHVIVQL